MTEPIDWPRPTREFARAAALGVVLVGAAFLAAFFTQSNEALFRLEPIFEPPPEAAPALDVVPPDRLYQFHAAFYTVWVSLLLTLPAFCTVWFSASSARAAGTWLAFWTVGLVAMLVHLYVAIGGVFLWDWDHALNKTVRVTIPIPDLVLTVWWGLDVALGWIRFSDQRTWIRVQRIAIHVALLLVFLIGFIKEGETLVSKGIGVVAAVSVAASLVIRWRASQRT